MIRYFFAIALVIASIFYIPNAYAKDSGFLGLSVGYFNAFGSNKSSINLRVEYRPQKSLIFKKLKPWFGLGTTLNGSLWAGAGLALEFQVSKTLFITPSFGIGLYTHGRKDIDLAYPIQLRSQIEFSRALKSQGRISLAFSHMSNAGWGDTNPGAEALMLYYSIPLNEVQAKQSDI